MYYLYLLQSKKDGNYYIGQTKNIKKRLYQHNTGLIRAIKHRGPLKLIGYKVYKSRNEARWREYQLKKHGDKKANFIDDLKKKSFPSEP